MPTPPCVKRSDDPKISIGIFSGADSGISSDEQVAFQASQVIDPRPFRSRGDNSENINSPVTKLLNKVFNFQELIPSITIRRDTNFYSDDEDADNSRIASPSGISQPNNSNATSSLKNILPQTFKAALYYICLPIIFICDLIRTSAQSLLSASFIVAAKPKNLWFETKGWFHRQHHERPFGTRTQQGVKLVFSLFIIALLLFLAIYIWGPEDMVTFSNDTWMTLRIKASSTLSTLGSFITWIGHNVAKLIHVCLGGLVALFDWRNLTIYQSNPGNSQQTIDVSQLQLEAVIESLLKYKELCGPD